MRDNRIILYHPEEISFSTHGLGVLSDALTCEVTEKLNGEFELFMAYPIDGALYSRFDYRHIVYAKPSPDRGPEPFRIYRISTPANGRVKVYARHLSYDTDGIPVSPFSAADTAGALSEIKCKAAVDNPFRIAADVNSSGEIKIKRPDSLRAVLMGKDNSLLSTYGGEYLFGSFNIRLCERRGSDHGYKIRYGVNLIDVNQERNCASVYTGVYPYFYEETDDTETIVELEPKIINLRGKFGFTRILPLDLSSEFSEIPTEEQLLKAAEAYIAEHDLGVPEVNITVEFALLRQYDEYKHLAFLESVELGDTVGVYFEKIGISAKSRVISTVYDAILDRYSVITLGDEKQDIVSTLVTMENAVREATYKADNGMRTAARLTVRADELGAEVKALAETTGENGRNIASLTVRADEQGAQLDLMAESISENAESIADLNIRADEQGAQISAKVSNKAGNTSSFGWDLSLTGWQLSANGVPVFVVTKDGAKVIGYIEADAGKIGGFRVSSNGLSYGTVFIGNNGVGFGKKPESIEEYETTFTTSIDNTGFLVSSHSKLYNPFLFGRVNISGDASKGHIVNSAIPFSMPGLILDGHNIADHEARIAALEEAVGTGGGSAKEYNVYILVNYFDADGGLAWSSVEVNGTYPVGTAFPFPEERDLDGVTYINHDGAVTFTVADADIRATLTYDEKVEEVETYRVQIYIEYQYANGEYKTEKDVDGYFTPGTSWRYPAYTTYDGKSFASEAGEDLDIVVGGTNIDNTIVYVEIESGGGDDGGEYDIHFSVGDTYSYIYGSVSPEVTINGSGLSWYDDGGEIVFNADSVGSGSVAIKESDIVLEEWTYIIT